MAYRKHHGHGGHAALHGGGGHHHHGGGWYGGGPGWGYGPQTVYVEPAPVFVDDGANARSMAYIMSLPKAQRPAAYVRLFGVPPAPGVLGNGLPQLDLSSTEQQLALVGVALLAYHFLKGRR